ncbi:hypothetical protein, partial [Erwinia amylovora]|uniref:hypothetical protein n=1 Tax=Erwinia amylovora TaxID=552 RepID=UPI0020BD5EF4
VIIFFGFWGGVFCVFDFFFHWAHLAFGFFVFGGFFRVFALFLWVGFVFLGIGGRGPFFVLRV